MRILLAAKHAPHGSRPIGGVQSWCRTVCRELEKRGYKAETWGVGQPAPVGNFDLGIVANIGDTAGVLAQCKRLVVVSHGIIPAENPNQPQIRAPIVYTSEEVRDHWNGVGFVVRQPIDMEFWRPGDRQQWFLTRFSYRGGLAFVSEIARARKLQYVHLKDKDSRECRDTLWQSACVLATGRAALESMACGVPVVLCDYRRSYQAPLLALDIEANAARNYSGRGGITPTVANVDAAIGRAIARGSMRRYVEENHNVVDITDQLLEIATLRRGTM